MIPPENMLCLYKLICVKYSSKVSLHSSLDWSYSSYHLPFLTKRDKTRLCVPYIMPCPILEIYFRAVPNIHLKERNKFCLSNPDFQWTNLGTIDFTENLKLKCTPAECTIIPVLILSTFEKNSNYPNILDAPARDSGRRCQSNVN